MTTAWVLQRIEVKDARRALLVALLGSAFVALLARVQLPFVPVPLTGQTLGVLLVGGLLGARLGALAMVLYLLEGALGLPVFARGGGLAYLLGPTGGYLFAFPLAAYLSGYLVERGAARRFFPAFLAMLAAAFSVFLLGVPWLGLYLGADLGRAAALGLYPFVPGEVLKAALAAFVLWRGYR